MYISYMGKKGLDKWVQVVVLWIITIDFFEGEAQPSEGLEEKSNEHHEKNAKGNEPDRRTD